MLFKGSRGYGLGELTRAIEGGGGEINAWTAFDHTVYHAVLGRDHVDAAIDALGDALIAPRVDPDELAREREVDPRGDPPGQRRSGARASRRACSRPRSSRIRIAAR